MFAHHVGVHMVRIHTQMPPQQRTEARGIQRRAGTDHPAARHTKLSGKPRGEMRHHIDRIGRHNEDRVGCVPQHTRHDAAEDRCIAL